MPHHDTAIIHPSAKIDPSTEIGPYVVIEEDVTIGPNNKILQHASICKHTTIGANNQIHMSAVIGHDPQDFSFEDKPSYTRIGDNNIFREFCTVHRGTKPDSETVIGNKNFFMALAHVGHNCIVGNETIIGNGSCLGGYVEVSDNVFLSANCLIHQFVTIGKYVMMSGHCGASKDVPPYMLVDGINIVAGINSVGLKRAGFSLEVRSAIKQAYKLLYRSGLNNSEAVKTIKENFQLPEVTALTDFIENSKRGICSHRSTGDARARARV